MKNKILKASLVIIGIILIIFAINHMVKYEISIMQANTSQAKSSTGGTLAAGELNPGTYSYNIYTSGFTVTAAGNSFDLPGHNTYCINPGMELNYDWQITFDQANGYQGRTYYRECGQCAQQPGKGLMTPIRYTMESEGILPAWAAFIISGEPVWQWSEDKQRGMWNLGRYYGQLLMGFGYSLHDGPSEYDQIAKEYHDYDQLVRDQGINATDRTDLNNMKVLVDTDTKQYIAGPFNIEYPYGVYGDIAFAGMSEMKIIGYNSNKEVVIEDIPIQKIVVKDQATGIYGEILEPQFFEPDPILKIDRTPQVYPASGQDFRVVFDDPNAGIEDEANQVEYISIKVKFKYMLANGKYSILKGVKYKVAYSCDHEYNPHMHDEAVMCEVPCLTRIITQTYRNCTLCGGRRCSGHPAPEQYCPGHFRRFEHYGCATTCYLARDLQQYLMLPDAIRSIYEQEIELGLYTDITMEIGGNVWEDVKATKQSDLDGRQGPNEPPVVGIPVMIYNTEGELVLDTVTDENGAYRLDRLDAMKKYYVEFQYNGQQYENTLYEDNLSGGYSNATESMEDRDNLNERFEEIDGDEGYTLDNINTYHPIGLFKISAYTGSDGKDALKTYPKYNKFVIGRTDEVIDGERYEAIYEEGDDQREVDFGIARRIEFDMAVKKDVYIATVKVNGKTEIYGYDKRDVGANDGTTGDTWNIQIVGGYNRGVSKDDYNFAGQNGNNQLLEVYVTYKVAVRNQSESMLGHVTKLYDYYDSTYEYMPELSWVSSTNYRTNTNTLETLQDAMDIEDVDDNEWGAEPKVISDENGRLTIDVDKKQQTGETVYVYLTFKVDGEGDELSLGTKGNKVEIGAFKTYYKQGTKLPHYGVNNFVVPDDNMIAGRVDRDSIPSTMGPEGEPREDDEDKAPDINVELTNEGRKMNGTVWEDERTQVSGNAVIGNGRKDRGEIGIAGVKVELIEKTVQGEDYKWKETTTDENGIYNFEGYVAGDYIVRFTYGNSRDTVATREDGGKNIVSYNGQDFKSTSYQVGVTQNEYTDKDNVYKGYRDVATQNESKTYGYDIATAESQNVSDAKDIWSRRQAVNYYSNGEDSEYVTNGLAEILASPYETPKYNGHSYSETEMNALMQELMNNTYMIAETGVIVVEVEKNMQTALENGQPNYELLDIDLGLEERPKAQLEIDKSISNIKVTLANGSVLFDVNRAGDNVGWIEHEEYNLAEHKDRNGKYKDYYGERNKHRYSFRYASNYPINRNQRGLVQLTMDEELMHGASIKITYKVKVTNVGEVDYKEQKFYYLGDSTGGTIVTTKANQVVDYVANNLQFDADRNAEMVNYHDGTGYYSVNEGWTSTSKDALVNRGLVNNHLSNNLSNFNNIIETIGLNRELKPGENVEKELVLSQLISTQNTEDDLTYSNMVEIVKTSNTVGRRMAYSVVGNQHPDASKAEEIDASLAEKVVILPPFGNMHIFYILVAVIGIILIAGITFIIKKVIKK